MRLRLGFIGCLAALVLASPAIAAEPKLSVPQAQLAAALTCSDGVDGATRAPVLLVQGTGASAKDNWSWTYEPAFDKLAIPWCQIDLPDHATGDVQINGEYVVSAIRTMHRRAGRRISIVGHSQGGMVPRWALRFWPSTRAMVDDVIGFAPSNHGTTNASVTCDDGSCDAAGWQQWDISNFMKALNQPVETWAGISYTNVITRMDEIVTPPTSGFLTTGEGRITNVATQDVCPTSVAEHLLLGLVDPTAYALAIDALEHDGPADPTRIDPLVCAQTVQPGIDPITGPADALAALNDYSGYQAAEVSQEPPLACYVTDTCASACQASPLRGVLRVRRLRHARARLGGQRVAVKHRGRHSVVRVNLRRFPAGRVKLRITGRTARGKRITIKRAYRRC
jgi:triacylglycerol esterase/lipase EstA (alpha/beta hydrolase family)